MLQIIITLAIYIALVIPVGNYMYHIATNRKTFADPVFNRIDRMMYKVCRIKGEGMTWKQYAISLLMTNAVMVFAGYFILRVQGILLANPNQIEGMEPTLSFNTIISFMTNTNLQHYAGESGLSYLSQMVVITFMMFTSAATGYAACMAFCRGITGNSKGVGNFYEDLIRITTRILLPFSIVIGILLIWQGVPQTLAGTATVETIEGRLQDIAMGPVAALESIKHLGTNGGGFFGANSSTPFENPTIISNLIELYSMMLLPGACVITFGKMAAERKKEKAGNAVAKIKRNVTCFGSQGRTIFAAMSILFLVGLTVCYLAEKSGNPLLAEAGLTDCEVIVGYQLSYPEESIRILTPGQCEEITEEGLYTCLIRNPHWQPERLTHGRADTCFLRDAKTPMTKEEVREVSICKLHLTQNAVVYDIGSGTGSVAIEIAGVPGGVQVYAIERKPEAVELLRKNREHFHMDNIQIIEAPAPEGLEELPVPTHAFIGGSGGRLLDILQTLYRKNPHMRIVINAISMETIAELKEVLDTFPMEEEEILQMQVSRVKKLLSYHLPQAENPVWICWFTFRETGTDPMDNAKKTKQDAGETGNGKNGEVQR